MNLVCLPKVDSEPTCTTRERIVHCTQRERGGVQLQAAHPERRLEAPAAARPRSRSGSRLLGGRRLRAALLLTLLLKDPIDRLLDPVDDDVRAVGLVALLVHAW